jgi:SAM-dependent methyltransferase
VLAELGIRVTAVDIDPLTIAAARAGAAHPNIAYHVSDVRSFLPTNRTYDAVISFFSCLGYLEDEAEDRAAIAALASLMRPGAGLLLSTANRVAIARVPETTSRFRFGSYEIARKDRYCAQTGYLTRLYTITDKMRATQETIIHRRRLYGPEEVRAMFEAAGLTLFRTYSDFTCGAFDRTCSSHAVYFSRLRELVI